MGFSYVPQELEKSVRWRYNTHVAGDRLDDDSGNVLRPSQKEVIYRVPVVVRSNQGLGGVGFGHAGAGGHAVSQRAGAGGDQQAVGVAVIVAGELDDFGASGVGAGQAQRGHAGFGAGVDEAHRTHRR